MPGPSEQQGEAGTAGGAQALSFAEFLEGVPPSQFANVDKVAVSVRDPRSSFYPVATPEIRLHCASDACNGVRFFRSVGEIHDGLVEGRDSWVCMRYKCSNCLETAKLFSLLLRLIDGKKGAGTAYKLGEYPVYGPPTPSRLIKLIGPDRETFLKGRRCENQGLGIGAFVYYRRVVENQKNRILDEIIKVAKRIGAPAAHLERLNDAKRETQFGKALASVRHAIPESLLVNGQNPLTLLYSALSDGLHDQTDERCLEIAQAVRVVLAELSDRLGQALKDEAELTSAVSRLMALK